MPKLTSDVIDDVIILSFAIEKIIFLHNNFNVKLFQKRILAMLCACIFVASAIMSSLISSIFDLTQKIAQFYSF